MKCRLLSPERTLFDGEVRSVQIPAYDGGVGIFPRHAPFIGKLGDGVLVLDTPSGERAFGVSGGFYRVLADVVTVLSTDAAEVKS